MAAAAPVSLTSATTTGCAAASGASMRWATLSGARKPSKAYKREEGRGTGE